MVSKGLLGVLLMAFFLLGLVVYQFSLYEKTIDELEKKYETDQNEALRNTFGKNVDGKISPTIIVVNKIARPHRFRAHRMLNHRMFNRQHVYSPDFFDYLTKNEKNIEFKPTKAFERSKALFGLFNHEYFKKINEEFWGEPIENESQHVLHTNEIKKESLIPNEELWGEPIENETQHVLSDNKFKTESLIPRIFKISKASHNKFLDLISIHQNSLKNMLKNDKEVVNGNYEFDIDPKSGEYEHVELLKQRQNKDSHNIKEHKKYFQSNEDGLSKDETEDDLNEDSKDNLEVLKQRQYKNSKKSGEHKEYFQFNKSQ